MEFKARNHQFGLLERIATMVRYGCVGGNGYKMAIDVEMSSDCKNSKIFRSFCKEFKA